MTVGQPPSSAAAFILQLPANDAGSNPDAFGNTQDTPLRKYSDDRNGHAMLAFGDTTQTSQRNRLLHFGIGTFRRGDVRQPPRGQDG